jgi:hypothetical protein
LEVAVKDVALKTGKDPGLGDTPMLSAWEGIVFVNSSTQENSNLVMTLQKEVLGVRQIKRERRQS